MELPLRLWSGLELPIEAGYSLVVLIQGAINAEWQWKEVMDYWAPVPEPTTYDGDLARGFELRCPDAVASFVYLLWHCDVSNRAYVVVDGERLAEQIGYGSKTHSLTTGCPQSLELGAHRTWSEIDVSAHIVVYGGRIESSGHWEAPGGAFTNPGLSRLRVRPGWNELVESPPPQNP